MKICRTGILCRCFLSASLAVAAWTPARAQAPAQQAPAGQQPAPAPAPQPPAQEEPPADETPQKPGETRPLKLPPTPPKVIDVRMPGEAGWYIGITGWLPQSAMVSEKGLQSTFADPSHLPLPGRAQSAFGAEFGVAAGLHNSLKISYFQAHKSGTQIAPVNMAVYSQAYNAGDELSTNVRFRDYKISYEYLMWPYPVEARKFRLKTLYQVHYVSVHNVIDAPQRSATPGRRALIGSSPPSRVPPETNPPG